MNTRLTDKHQCAWFPRRQRGAVTAIMAVLLLVVVALAQQVVMRSAGTGASSATLQSDGVEAMQLAESGLERAMYLYENGASCSGLAAEGPQTFGNGTFEVTTNYATDFDGEPLADGQCRVRVVGKAGNGNVSRTAEGIFRATIQAAWIVGANGTVGYWNGAEVTSGAATSWTADRLNDVTCVSATDCWAVAENGGIIHWNGTDWTNSTSGTSEDLNDISCVATNDCWVVGDNGKILRWNGTAWSSVASSTTDHLYGIHCASASFCLAVGDDQTIQKWNGTSWSDNYGGSYSGHFNSVHCTSTTNCWAVGYYDSDGYIKRTTNGGGSWSTYSEDRNEGFHSVWCSSSSNCWGVGDDDDDEENIERWTGGSWNNVDSNVNKYLRDVHCVDDNNCWAVGQGYTVRKWNGSSPWGSSHSAYTSNYFYGIYCVSTSDCWAVGNNSSNKGYIERWNGSSWDDSTYNASTSTTTWYDVDCVASTDCTMAGSGGAISRYDGSSWTDSDLGSMNFYGVSCYKSGATTNCYAVGSSSAVQFWNGSSWASRTSGLGSDDLRAVDCPSSTCYAVEGDYSDPDGDVWRWSGSTWTRDYYNSSYRMYSIDCYANGDCRSVGEEGSDDFHFWRGSGTSWTRYDYDEGSDNSTDLRGISCPADSAATGGYICWAVGDDQYSKYTLFKWSGTSWSKQFLSDASPRDMNAVHCGAKDQCLAVGDSGQILHYDGTSWHEEATYTSNNLYGVFMFPKSPPKLMEWREPN